MNETWNISLVGITFALGGLGLIAVFFAIIGHFFKKNSERKKVSNSASSLAINGKKEIQEKNSKTVQHTVERSENIEEEEEMVAAISATIMAYAPASSKIVSINRMNVERKGSKNLWRLHNAQTTWKIRKARKGQ